MTRPAIFRSLIASLLLAASLTGCSPMLEAEAEAMPIAAQTFAQACTALQSKCELGDQSACQSKEQSCPATSTAALPPGSTQLPPRDGVCTTYCCAMCTRCANNGSPSDCSACQSNCPAN